MSDTVVAGTPNARAFLRVGGVTLVQHQLGLALALDCQKLICLARAPSPDLLAFQQAAEDAGLPVSFAYSSQQLSSLVTANDDLVIVREGLFADPDEIGRLLDKGASSVLVQPVDEALPLGFERIDINNADAGIMRIPGHLVEQLHQLAPDCDIPSALLRIALQSGVPTREVPADVRMGVNWRLIRSESEALSVEDDWLRERIGTERSPSPGAALARAGVLAFGSSMLHAGNASNIANLAVLLTLAISAGMGWFGLIPAGLVLCALAWILVKVGGMLRVAERQALSELTPAIPRANALGWLVDLAIGFLAVRGSNCDSQGTVLSCIFAPAMLLLLLQLAPRHFGTRLAAWSTDRALLSVVLAVAALFGRLDLAVQIMALVLVLTGIGTPARRQS